MKLQNKRAITPLMATFVLILFAIGFGVFIMIWGQDFIERSSFVGSESLCDAVNFDIEKIGEFESCLTNDELSFFIRNTGTDINALVLEQNNEKIVVQKKIETGIEKIVTAAPNFNLDFTFDITPLVRDELCKERKKIVTLNSC